MNYFTKEELKDIADELLMNPTRETLKMLNEKYNGTVSETKAPEEAKPAEMAPNATPNATVEVPNLEVPTLEASNQAPASMAGNMPSTPNFPNGEAPSLEVPSFASQPSAPESTPISVATTPWENGPVQNPNVVPTTDNFNNTQPASTIKVEGTPQFFETNNQMPNPGLANSQMQQGPTIFSQLEQNFTGQQ